MESKQEITRVNCKDFLNVFIAQEETSVRKIAKAINCPVASVERIINGKTLPSDEMLKQIGIMIELGFKRYSTLTEAEKEKISETIGAVGGGILGFSSITAVLSGIGIAGLSGAGIVSGLAALGAIVGGGMVAGLGVVAAIPVVTGLAGYGIVKGVKYAVAGSSSSDMRFDPAWEMLSEAIAA